MKFYEDSKVVDVLEIALQPNATGLTGNPEDGTVTFGNKSTDKTPMIYVNHLGSGSDE